MMLPLNTISSYFPDPEIRSLAGDLRVCIGTLGAVWSEEMKRHTSDFKTNKKLSKQVKTVIQQQTQASKMLGHQETTESLHNEDSASVITNHKERETFFQIALRELKEPLIPVRGHALISLTKLVNSKDAETLQSVATILQVFKENLCHSDSYIYLAAINGLVALALSAPSTSENILKTLCQEYACLSGRPTSNARTRHDGKLRVGDEAVARQSYKTRHDVETRMKLGEALVKVFQELQAMLPHFLSDVVAPSLLTAVRDPEPLIRASSLSNIAEVCSAGKGIHISIFTEVCIIICIVQLVHSLGVNFFLVPTLFATSL